MWHCSLALAGVCGLHTMYSAHASSTTCHMPASLCVMLLAPLVL